ncbi:hypothetical protein ACJX0J_023176, partial [Zea mays]
MAYAYLVVLASELLKPRAVVRYGEDLIEASEGLWHEDLVGPTGTVSLAITSNCLLGVPLVAAVPLAGSVMEEEKYFYLYNLQVELSGIWEERTAVPLKHTGTFFPEKKTFCVFNILTLVAFIIYLDQILANNKGVHIAIHQIK